MANVAKTKNRHTNKPAKCMYKAEKINKSQLKRYTCKSKSQKSLSNEMARKPMTNEKRKTSIAVKQGEHTSASNKSNNLYTIMAD